MVGCDYRPDATTQRLQKSVGASAQRDGCCMDSFPVEEDQRRAPVFCISADDEALFEGFKVFSGFVKQEINDLGLVLRYTVCEIV